MSSIAYPDRRLSPEQRAAALLKDMTLDEKMAQVNCVFPYGGVEYDFEWIADHVRGGIGEVSTLEVRTMKTLREAAKWQRKVQQIVMDSSPHHIPAIFHMEGLCGTMIQDGISLPSGIARGAGFNPALEEKMAAVVARQEALFGATHILAPVLDIARDPRMGRYGESYGEDPTLAAALGAAYVRGVQQENPAERRPESVAKHFLAFHNSQGGIHGTHSDTPPRLLREVYAKPFQAAIQAGLKGIMPCYCSMDGEPASVSKRLLTGLLREEMGFDGLCVSDYGGINNAHWFHRIGETLEDTGLMAMAAGMDIEMPSPDGYGEGLKALFESGKADRALLDQAVLRVLTAKFRMGLFEHPFAADEKILEQSYALPEDRELTLRSAHESMVLLKNDGTLPLRKDVRKIALIGPHADSPRKFFGGYTLMCMAESTLASANSIAGVEGGAAAPGRAVRLVPGTNVQSDEGPEFDAFLHRQKPDCVSLLTQLKQRMPNTEVAYAYGYPVAGKDESGFAEALHIAKDADVLILTLGGKHGTCSIATMGEGVDASSINLPPCQDAFIQAAAKLNKPMIGVHLDGRPISSDMADSCLNVILEAWSPAECGAQAIVDTLLGMYNPAGRLPVSVPYHAGQIPVYYNHPNGSCWHQAQSIGFQDYVDLPHRPRYCFGYGLSYTQFRYDRFALSKSELRPDEALEISAEITNVGSVAGDEVVQLYVSDCFASRTRPVQELAGFCRVHIKAGDTKSIRFTLLPDQLAFLDQDMRWKIEKGDFSVRIGASSEDTRAEGIFRITADAWIDGKMRSMIAKAEVEP